MVVTAANPRRRPRGIQRIKRTVEAEISLPFDVSAIKALSRQAAYLGQGLGTESRASEVARKRICEARQED